MLFSQVRREHILLGIRDFEDKGYPDGFRPSTTYDLKHESKSYPPKPIMAYANFHAVGRKIERYFEGGIGTECFNVFEHNGFEVIPKNQTIKSVDVKEEFAQWLLKNATVNYQPYYGNTIKLVVERLNEIDGFFSERNLFEVNISNYKEIINYIKFNNSKKERLKRKEFYDYDRKHGKGRPIAILGKENYIKFLEEKFSISNVSYWIFQGNPDIYNISNALKGGHLQSWKVAAHKDKIKIGDKVIIWQTGSKAGCYALAEVVSNVGFLKEEDFELQHYTKKQTTDKNERVKLKIVKYFTEKPILWSTIKDLSEFSNFKAGNQGTNFLATKEEYNTILAMDNKPIYTWVQTHKELTKYLLDTENKQKELIELLEASGATLFNDQNPKGRTFKLEELDPFTFYCYINKYGAEKRLAILQNIARKLSITVPKDEKGIPSTNAQKVWMFPYKYNRKNNEIERLWKFFYAVNENELTDDLFNDVLNIRNVAKIKLTEALFYVDPENYFPINGPTKRYLKEFFEINPNFTTYTEYNEILKQIRSKTDRPFYQLSYEGWGWNNTRSPKQDNTQNNDSIQIIPMNKILYGPPGTGKTYYLKNNLFDKYTIKGTSISKEKYFEEVVSNLTWWQVIALALLESGIINVTSILANRWVAKKASLSESKNVRATIWGTLQMHTIEESETVAYKQRQVPLIFDKTDNKEWELLKTELDEQSPELYDILNSVNNFEASPNKTIENFDFVTFHQSFAYEDFIEGIKPILPEEGDETKDLGYTIENGVFKNLCIKAQNDPENKYAIFIDEINRGNVSAIFGELITLIELDKRKGAKNELSIKLPYSKKDFSVPSNLDIYGTMNTADRSVEALDTALRRRFVFKEVMPDAELLERITYDGFNLKEVLETINGRIEALLDRDHTIGHSYYIQLESNDTDGLLNVFKNSMIPLLQEYFYNDYEKIALVLGSGFVKEKTLNKDIFIKFAELPNIEDPDLSNAYELITDIIDIEQAVRTLLGKPNA